MDRIDEVLRRYEDVRPKLGRPEDAMPRVVDVWLDEYVVPAIAEYSSRPSFREMATWPIVCLRPGAETPERRLVDEVDERISACVRALRNLTSTKTVSRGLKEQFPPAESVVGETVRVDGGVVRTVERRAAMIDELSEQQGAVRGLLGPNADLVQVEDYFEPVQEAVEVGDGEFVQRGELIVSINPELLPVGNFVVRCLLRRVDRRRTVIEQMLSRCRRVRATSGPRVARRYETVDHCWSDVQPSVAALKEVLRTNADAQLRDACVVCTQIYAAFHPMPDLTWLGLPDAIVDQGRSALVHRIRHSWHRLQAFDRVAMSLGELRGLYVDGRPDASNLEEAIASGKLVIDGVTGTIYWECKALEITHGDARRLLLALAVDPQRDVGGTHFRPAAVTNDWMTTARNRLKNSVPTSLDGLIGTGYGRATYRLNLLPSQIHHVGRKPR